jgi:hypothetical protein
MTAETESTRSPSRGRCISMARSKKSGLLSRGSGTRTKGKGGGTSRQRARGGRQRGGGTKQVGSSKGVRARRGSGASGGGSGWRSSRALAKSATRTGPRKVSRHAPTKAQPARPTGLARRGESARSAGKRKTRRLVSVRSWRAETGERQI